jgi:hypothetical protein
VRDDFNWMFFISSLFDCSEMLGQWFTVKRKRFQFIWNVMFKHSVARHLFHRHNTPPYSMQRSCHLKSIKSIKGSITTCFGLVGHHQVSEVLSLEEPAVLSAIIGRLQSVPCICVFLLVVVYCCPAGVWPYSYPLFKCVSEDQFAVT